MTQQLWKFHMGILSGTLLEMSRYGRPVGGVVVFVGPEKMEKVRSYKNSFVNSVP